MFDYRSLPDASKYQSWGSKSVDELLSFIRDNHAIEALRGDLVSVRHCSQKQ
jgi:hypothetical protein